MEFLGDQLPELNRGRRRIVPRPGPDPSGIERPFDRLPPIYLQVVRRGKMVFLRTDLNEDFLASDRTPKVTRPWADPRRQFQFFHPRRKHSRSAYLVHRLNEMPGIPEEISVSTLDHLPRRSPRKDFKVPLDLCNRSHTQPGELVGPGNKLVPNYPVQKWKPLLQRRAQCASHCPGSAAARAMGSPARRRGRRAGSSARRRRGR